MNDRPLGFAAGAAALAAMTFLVAIPTADGATGRLGSPPTVTCGPQRSVAVSTPGILPLDSPVAVAEYWGWVAYRVHVWQWNGTSWTKTGSSSWAAYEASNLGKRRNFYTLGSSGWTAGSLGPIGVSGGGYYTVTVDYYWFDMGGGSASLSNQWVKSYVDARGPTGSAWCHID